MIRTDAAQYAPDCKIPPVRVHITHKENCEFAESLREKLRQEVPEARISSEVGDEDFFEFYVNDKIVFSKHYLGHFPNQEEMVQVAYWANKGKSFMHMYLCTVAEGGEPNMVITDRKNTPLAKRIILACTIS